MTRNCAHVAAGAAAALLLFAAAVAGDSVGSYGCTAQVCRLDNGRLRFGIIDPSTNTNEGTFLNSAMMTQPYYFSLVDNTYYKLTYRELPLEAAVGFGTGTTHWTGGQVFDVANYLASGANLVTDYSGFVVLDHNSTTDTSLGYGTVVASRELDLSGQSVIFENNVTLRREDRFVTVISSITNNGATPMDNVYIWTGTGDDFIGAHADQNGKTRGKFVRTERGASFVASTFTGDLTANAVKVANDNEAVFYYTDEPGGTSVHSSCCALYNAYNQDPATAPINGIGDGSYAVVLSLGTVAPGQKVGLRWYYAAAQISLVDDMLNAIALNGASPSTTPSPSTAPTTSRTASRTVSVSRSVLASRSVTRSPTRSVSVSSSETRSPSASTSTSPVPNDVTPSETASPSLSSSESPSLTPSPVSPSVTASETLSPSETPSESVSVTLSQTASLSLSASAEPSVSASLSETPSETSSPSSSASEEPSPSVSASAEPTPSVSVSVEPSPVSPSETASPSSSVSQEPSPSVSRSESASETASSSVSASAEASPSVSVSVEPSPVSASETGTSSASGSSSASRSPSASVSASQSASATTTGSESASLSASRTVSATQSRTVSETALPTPSTSVSVTPTRSFSSTSTGTRTALASFSSTPSTAAVVPVAHKIPLVLTLVGGDGDALRAGSGIELRKAIADLTGVSNVPGASVVFTSLTTSVATYESKALTGLANSTFNATALNATSVTQGSKQRVSENDLLNAPVRRLLSGGSWVQEAVFFVARRLQGACNPVTLTTTSNSSTTTVSVPTTVAAMDITIPPSYFAGSGAFDAAAVKAASEKFVERLTTLLNNATTTTAAFSSFAVAWSTCTGLPASSGVITGFGTEAVVVGSTSPPADTSGPAIWPVVLSVIIPVIIISIGFAIATSSHVATCSWCCCAGAAARRRRSPEDEEEAGKKKKNKAGDPQERYSYALPPGPVSPTACRIDADSLTAAQPCNLGKEAFSS